MFDPEAFDVPDVVFYETKITPLVAKPGEVLVRLTGGYEALIDDLDLPLLQGRSFYAHQSRSNIYARNRAIGYLHQIVCGARPGWVVDHLNRHPLDCRRDNLRICGFDANAQNSEYHNTTGFRGVSLDRGRYRARIAANGKTQSLGYYATPEEAAQAYDTAALTVYGPFAWTNFKRQLAPARQGFDIPF